MVIPKILAPVNSFEGAVRVIQAGADEVYCGVGLPGKFRNFILYRGPGMGKAQLPTYRELAKIVKHAHRHGVKVVLTVNEPFMSEMLDEEMEKHISLCLDTEVDGLMIGDMGVLSLVKSMGVDIPLIASTYFATTNYEAIDFLRKVGFSRVVLERHLTIREIFDIVTNSRMDLEVFCHGSGCSNINGNCHLYHYDTSGGLGSVDVPNAMKVFPPCTWPFEIYDIDNEEKKLGVAPILDAHTECSLCYLSMLVEAGVAGIKIVGRLMDAPYQEKITETYRKLLDMMERQVAHESPRVMIKSLKNDLSLLYSADELFSFGPHGVPYDLLSFFQREFCSQGRCYFSHLFHVRPKYAIKET